jgi:hypothetical protein
MILPQRSQLDVPQLWCPSSSCKMVVSRSCAAAWSNSHPSFAVLGRPRSIVSVTHRRRSARSTKDRRTPDSFIPRSGQAPVEKSMKEPKSRAPVDRPKYGKSLESAVHYPRLGCTASSIRDDRTRYCYRRGNQYCAACLDVPVRRHFVAESASAATEQKRLGALSTDLAGIWSRRGAPRQ